MFPGKGTREYWPITDPATAKGSAEERLVAFREVRDYLEARIRAWPRERNYRPVRELSETPAAPTARGSPPASEGCARQSGLRLAATRGETPEQGAPVLGVNAVALGVCLVPSASAGLRPPGGAYREGTGRRAVRVVRRVARAASVSAVRAEAQLHRLVESRNVVLILKRKPGCEVATVG